jgi:diguanylate cyclase (GGDEF)-like protein
MSQATFALVLALLAWTDRRTRGMAWLASACGLQLVSTFLRATLKGKSPWELHAAVAGLLPLMFFFVFMGLRCFLTRRKMRSPAGPLAVSIYIALVMAVAPFNALLSLEMGRLGVAVIAAIAASMLWRTRVEALRKTARVTAGFVLLTGSMFLLRALVVAVGVNARLENLVRDAEMTSATVLALMFVAMFVAETKRRLHDETRLDALTGLRNRRAMEEMAANQVRLSERTGRPLAMLMMDLDYFKQLNDTWGHGLGDRALRAVGGVLLTVTGGDDMVARMGGEEFAVLLPGRSMLAAQAVAERLRATVAGLRLNEGDKLASFTVSIGVGVLHAGETTWTEMLRRADVALYRAKREGRNRVVLCAQATTDQERAAAEAGGWMRRTTTPAPAAIRAAKEASESKESRTVLR